MTNPRDLGIDPKEVMTEVQMRKNVMKWAKRFGCDLEVKAIFDKYDRLLKASEMSNDPTERRHIAVMGIAELHKYLGCRGSLVVNGQVVIPGDPDAELESPIKKLG